MSPSISIKSLPLLKAIACFTLALWVADVFQGLVTRFVILYDPDYMEWSHLFDSSLFSQWGIGFLFTLTSIGAIFGSAHVQILDDRPLLWKAAASGLVYGIMSFILGQILGFGGSSSMKFILLVISILEVFAASYMLQSNAGKKSLFSVWMTIGVVFSGFSLCRAWVIALFYNQDFINFHTFMGILVQLSVTFAMGKWLTAMFPQYSSPHSRLFSKSTGKVHRPLGLALGFITGGVCCGIAGMMLSEMSRHSAAPGGNYTIFIGLPIVGFILILRGIWLIALGDGSQIIVEESELEQDHQDHKEQQEPKQKSAPVGEGPLMGIDSVNWDSMRSYANMTPWLGLASIGSFVLLFPALFALQFTLAIILCIVFILTLFPFLASLQQKSLLKQSQKITEIALSKTPSQERVVTIVIGKQLGFNQWMFGVSKEAYVVFTSHHIVLLMCKKGFGGLAKALAQPDQLIIRSISYDSTQQYEIGGLMMPPGMHLFGTRLSLNMDESIVRFSLFHKLLYGSAGKTLSNVLDRLRA